MDGSRMSGFETEAARWQAFVDHDPRADGAFLVAVVTTGIFCRPTCPARRPLQRNIRFFEDATAAIAAGFRACKRCHPTGEAPDAGWRAAIERACLFVEAQEDPPGLETMAAAAGLSPFHFHRVFKRLVGVTPKAYVAARKAGRLRSELAAGTPVAQAIYGAGYGSPSRVYEAAGATLGMTPAVYRRGGRGERIRWTILATPLGDLVLGATDRGICLIEFCEPGSSPETRLTSRFPAARIERGDADFEDAAQRVIDYIEVPARGLDLPLDLRGTAFQQRVWQALREIPLGATASYGEIARRIGQPNAARAVARACAANAVALVVPCHRVIASDGSLGGYRWGTARKARLVENETVGAAPSPRSP